MPVGFPDYYGGLTLPVTVPEGGTGQTSITANALVYGAGTSKLVETNVGAAGQVCIIDKTTLVPTFEDFDLSTATITGILPVANGGSGSSSPALVAGTAISVSGTWPNQTINNTSNYASLADPLPVDHGGTGTTTPALVEGNGISISGSWPDQTITNSQYSYFSAGILAIAHGGTGSSSPALVAGSNISITGTWPNNTINVVTSPTFTGNVNKSNGSAVITLGTPASELVGITLQDTNRADIRWNDSRLAIYAGTGTGVPSNGISIDTSGAVSLSTPLAITSGGTGSTSPSLVAGSNISITGSWPDQTVNLSSTPAVTTIQATQYSSSGPSLLIGAASDLGTNNAPLAIAIPSGSSVWPFIIVDAGTRVFGIKPDGTFSDALKLATPLAVAYGGTGASSFSAAGLLSIADSVDLTAQTSSISPTTLLATPATGVYRVSIAAYVNSPTGTSTLSVSVHFYQEGATQNLITINGLSASSGHGVDAGVAVCYAESTADLTYSTSWTSGGGSDNYDIHIKVEKL